MIAPSSRRISHVLSATYTGPLVIGCSADEKWTCLEVLSRTEVLDDRALVA